MSAEDLSAYERDQVTRQTPDATTTTATTSLPPARVGARVAWVLASIAIAYFAAEGYENFAATETAPQQAVAAAWGCFQILIPYTGARAVQEILTA